MKEIHDIEIKNMLKMAAEAKERAYAPYSKFKVGACVKTGSGAYYAGCNIENSAYSPTCCAERVAIYKAYYDCERHFDAIAIVSDDNNIVSPCGVCRQVMAEFFTEDAAVICGNKAGKYKIFSVGDLLPSSFSLNGSK